MAETTTTENPVAGPVYPTEPVLRVRDLVIGYKRGSGDRNEDAEIAVNEVSFDLYPGESLALIGESGCGKTTLGLALLRLLPKLGVVLAGSAEYRRRDGTVVDLLGLAGRDLRAFRWAECAMVFQGAMSSFNPVTRIWDQMVETVQAHDRSVSRAAIRDMCYRVLERVELEPEPVLRAFQHELSGGMRQRALIAMSMLLDPQVLILDEPTTALDILTQRSIIDLIHDLHEEREFAMMFVSHDLAVAAELASRVATMYEGRFVEMGDVRDIFYRPEHPYTRSLIGAVPTVTEDRPEVPGDA